MADPLSILTAAIETLKKLREVSQRIKHAETKNLIADLGISLADLKLEVAQLKEENVLLKQEVAKAAEQRDFRANLELNDGVYFFVEPVPGRPEGPYCPTCFDVDGTLVIVGETQGSFTFFGKYHCNNCNGHFGKAI